MTVEQMQKGSLNLDALEAWVEGAPNTTITTPNGRVVPTMSTAVANLTTDGIMQDNKTQRQINAELVTTVNSVSGGYFKAFDTLANLNAATGMTTGQVAKVMSDIAANNGDYRYNGSAWVKGYDALTDAKTYANDYVKNQANDLFKSSVQLAYTNNMTVRRYLTDGTPTNYAAGTYQSMGSNNKVNLAVTASGSGDIKHYFLTPFAGQKFSVEFTITKNNVQGDCVGIGFKTGDNFTAIAYSNSGNLINLSNGNHTNLQTGLTTYTLNDVVKFDYDGTNVIVYINGVQKASTALSMGEYIAIGQKGFSSYSSWLIGETFDPVRNYVTMRLSNTTTNAECYYSYDLNNKKFYIYTQVKNNLYVGFEVKRETDMSDAVYQDYYRIVQALFYTRSDSGMTATGKTALGVGESEFVFKQDSTKTDFTGGYHGDEVLTDVKFLADGVAVATTANIGLTACRQFEYVEKSTMHETANSSGFIAGHPVIAYHTKHTIFKSQGYKTKNYLKFNYNGTLSTLYHGIACIHKDVATTVFNDADFTDQTMNGSTNMYFNAVGARLYKSRNDTNKLAAEASATQVKNAADDATSTLFVHDRTADSKYYRQSPSRTVAVGELHESYFECKFLSV